MMDDSIHPLIVRRKKEGCSQRWRLEMTDSRASYKH